MKLQYSSTAKTVKQRKLTHTRFLPYGTRLQTRHGNLRAAPFVELVGNDGLDLPRQGAQSRFMHGIHELLPDFHIEITFSRTL
jgi:hypothetical protein